MRIVDVNEFYSPTGGGVRTYVDRKMAILSDLGHELIVIAPGREDSVDERPGGGRIIYIKAPPLPFDSSYGLFWDAAPVTRLLDQLAPDVVEVSSPWRPAWIVGDWAGDALKIFFMHNDNVSSYPQRWFRRVAPADRIERAFDWYNRYMRSFLGKYDAVVSNGTSLVKRMTPRGIHIDAAMPLGIEGGWFSPAHRDERLRGTLLQQCGLPPEGRLLLGLGRHHPEKRWTTIVDAVERAGRDLPIGLILIGDGIDRKRIEKRVADSPHIRLFRPVYDRARLARIMASCDALIHGAETETFGLVAAEALASGLPLIVPDVGGCAELADPLFAETYQAGNARACAQAIRRFAAREPALLRRAAIQGAQKVRTDRQHAVALIDYYAELLAAREASVARSA